MEMTQSLLWLCLALAAIGLLVLAFALRRLVAAANNRSASGAWLLAAGGVLTAGLFVIDSVILWCLIWKLWFFFFCHLLSTPPIIGYKD